jgi:hypothetical protein
MLVVKVVEGDSKKDFEFEVAKILERAAEIVSIQFSVTPDIHSSMGGGAYSSGETYYALLIYKI